MDWILDAFSWVQDSSVVVVSTANIVFTALAMY